MSYDHSKELSIDNLNGKKLYFASDFHLGVPTAKDSLAREKKIVNWLESIKDSAHTIYLVGDIFDFWFEYRNAIPRGFIRLQGKLAELTDSGIPVVFFTGNHDMWMFDYFTTELNIPIYRKPQSFTVGQQKILLGHGDGLGPGDKVYKTLKWFFNSKVCQWLFARIHPNTGIGIANFWSRRSRISSSKSDEDKFKGEKEFLLQYCHEVKAKEHHDWYVFGHRHLPLNIEIDEQSRYINLGEWVNHFTYGVYDGSKLELHEFKNEV